MSTKLFKLIKLFLFFVFIIKNVNCGCCLSAQREADGGNIVHDPQHDVVPDELDQLPEEYGGWDEHDGEEGNNEWQHNVEEEDDEDEQIPQVENFEDPEEEDNEEDNHFNFPALLANDIPDFDQGDTTTTTSLSAGAPRTSSDSN
ncbi:unnamed protein product [Meloidogyne enterolobii]|uniref:Uncharacterized protein n=1 Tax=Meloidogyne enterolobii TaxID=390850 RepID=A0ACB1AWL1_MELEN